jgi:hypothetical protein
MFTIDKQGLRQKEIGDVKVDDYREIARMFTNNPQYKDKSIYLIPDNYIHQLQDNDRYNQLDKDEVYEDVDNVMPDFSEIKMKAGRMGRKIKKADISRIENLYESIKGTGFMDDKELDEYIEALTETEPVKHVLRSAFEEKEQYIPLTYLHPSISFSRNEFDTEDVQGELVPMPITNFNKEEIDAIKDGKTAFWKKSTRKGDDGWKKVFIRGNYVDELKQNGYNGEQVYTDAPREIKSSSSDNSILEEPTFVPYKPTGIEMIEITYIYGPNRSGKTYYAAKYARLWSEMFENWPIYLFSRRDADKVLDDIPALSRVKIDQDIVDNPLSMTDFEKSLVIFDDVDTISDKKIRVAIQKLRDDIMETGRQKMIYVINTSHLGSNYGPTRTVLNEANSYTLFPRKGNYAHNFRILKDKMGIKPEVIKRIMDKPHGLAHQGKWGWITVYKDSPQYVISETGVHLL